MAQRQSALRRRSHHPRPTPHPFTWSTPHPGRSVITADALDLVEHIRDTLHKAPDCNCDACGRAVLRGHQAYVVTLQDATAYVTCTPCGEAIRLHCGYPVD